MSLIIEYQLLISHSQRKKKEKTGCTQHYCTYQEKKFHKAAINKENIRVLRRSVHLKYIGIGCFMVKPFILERFTLGN